MRLEEVFEIDEVLERVYYDNTVQDYLVTFGLVFLGLLIVRAFKHVVLARLIRWADRTDTNFDNYVVESLDRYGIPAIYVSIVYIGINYLVLSERVENILQIATTVIVTVLVIRFVSATVLLLLQAYVREQENGEEKVKQLHGIMLIVNVIIWFIGIVFLLDNLGYDVTTVIAGLGIGGIAVALAAQNILGDLFNYFVIFFDRPFEVGDFIIIDQKMGVVEYVGIKTTRIKSLSGEQLVFSNSDLTNSRIHNYKRMQRRRVLFKVSAVYQTPYELVQRIPGVLKAVVQQQDLVEFDRAHFASYGDSSLDFEVVYYVLSSDYNKYMDVQQAINLGIFQEFHRMGVEFAYPTRTLYVAAQDQPQPVREGIM
ncbi:small-conductance mechanosensitive channel [Pontibacter ummariensis]|uniref:Small-conductance mechanosensitive channel n=1 Tax=Pontibacter ummariensis TaxID=1610492 RepID=A0A239IAG4_9BACT|nr:mechanosensitive ion channel family protein [Pontibacter ummariensis]PRY09960.1 small-conductance mechanosensitive channel [Pontibacter ummariensis]SNS90519.1 Small-conductance mechanosensitive channel [Pontibacter ummariensis]